MHSRPHYRLTAWGPGMSRHGADVGPVLTAATAWVGMPVRMTGGWMAGSVGVIVDGEGTIFPRVRFGDGATPKKVDCSRLQIIRAQLTPELQARLKKLEDAEEERRNRVRLAKEKRALEAREQQIRDDEKLKEERAQVFREREMNARWAF